MVQKSVPSKVSRNSGNYWISEMLTIQPKEIPEILGAKLNGKNTIENLGIPREVVLCFGNFGRCCSIRYRKLPKIQRGRFGWMESAQCLWLANYLKGEKKSYYVWLWRKNSEILACVAGAWKYWAQEKRGARHRHPSRVSLARARSLLRQLLPSHLLSRLRKFVKSCS